MYNWSLLLLAFFAAFHPIASFTERNYVDGRGQCCEHRLLRDTRFDGKFRLSKPEDRRLNYRAENLDRRYELREHDSVLTRSSVDRRLIEFPFERQSRTSPEFDAQTGRVREIKEQQHRSSRAEAREHRTRNTDRISTRDVERDERNREITRERIYKFADALQNNDDNRGTSHRFSRDNSRIVRFSRDDRRFTLSSDNLRDRQTRRNRDKSEEHRKIQKVRETRNILQRARDDVTRSEIPKDREDRRIVRIRMSERFITQAESRFDNNRDRRSLDRRETLAFTETSRVTSESRSADRRRDMREVNRERLEANQHAIVQRVVVDRQASRDSLVRRESSEEERQARFTSDRSRNVRNGNSERHVTVSSNGRNLAVESNLLRETREGRRDMRDELQRITTRRNIQTTASRNVNVRRDSNERVSEERKLGRETADRSRNDIRLQRQVLSVNGRRFAPQSRSADRVREIREESRLDNREMRDDRQRSTARRVIVEKASFRDARVYRENSQRASEGSRLARQTTDSSRNEIRHVRFDSATRREVQNDDRHARNIQFERFSETNRGNSRMINRETAHSPDRVIRNRDERRSENDARESKIVGESHERQASSRTGTRITGDIEHGRLDSRFRSNSDVARSRAYFASMLNKQVPLQYQTTGLTWQNFFYTLQGIYLCGVLIQLMSDSGVAKKKFSALNWLSGHNSLIKVD